MPAEGPPRPLRLDAGPRPGPQGGPRAPVRGQRGGRGSREGVGRPPRGASVAWGSRWRPAAALVAALLAGMFLERHRAKAGPPSYQQITFGRGTIRSARFAPDGQTIVYSAAWDDSPLKLFLKHPSSPDSLPLELPSANLLGVSSSGEMAIAVGCRSTTPACAGGRSPAQRSPAARPATWRRSPGRRLGAGRPGLPSRPRRGREVAHRRARWARSCTRPRPRHLRAAVPEGRPDRLSRPRVPGGRRGHGRRHRPLRKEGQTLTTAGPSGARPRLVPVRRGDRSRPLRRREPLALRRDGSRAAAVVTRVPGRLKLHDIARTAACCSRARAPGSRILGVLGAGDTRERDLSFLTTRSPPTSRQTRESFSSTRRARRVGRTTPSTSERRTVRPSCASVRGMRSPSRRDGDGRCRDAVANSPFFLLPTGTEITGRSATPEISPERRPRGFRTAGTLLFAGTEAGRGLRLYIQSIDGEKPRPIGPEGILTALPGFAVLVRRDAGGRDRLGPPGLLGRSTEVEARAVPGIQEGEVPLPASPRMDGPFTSGGGETSPPGKHRLDVETGKREAWKDLLPADPAGWSASRRAVSSGRQGLRVLLRPAPLRPVHRRGPELASLSVIARSDPLYESHS